ncbi:uncharacterized protein VTP21DRAFT_5410 [Calcarisporiella thermophila]|uniref:uncharacterized protein n=1 Tax=Calcarisporiella thermophila TaxID=911321 RepID=UPI0037440539
MAIFCLKRPVFFTMDHVLFDEKYGILPASSNHKANRSTPEPTKRTQSKTKACMMRKCVNLSPYHQQKCSIHAGFHRPSSQTGGLVHPFTILRVINRVGCYDPHHIAKDSARNFPAHTTSTACSSCLEILYTTSSHYHINPDNLIMGPH